MTAGNLLLNGPIWWFFVGVLFLSGMLAVYVIADSIARLVRKRYVARDPWWLYTIPQAIYLAILLTVQFPFVPNWGGAIVFGLMPFVIAEQFAYLLRVVFPKPPAAEPPATQPQA